VWRTERPTSDGKQQPPLPQSQQQSGTQQEHQQQDKEQQVEDKQQQHLQQQLHSQQGQRVVLRLSEAHIRSLLGIYNDVTSRNLGLLALPPMPTQISSQAYAFSNKVSDVFLFQLF
jgi:hypothetical protein